MPFPPGSIHVWKGCSERKTCRDCHRPFLLVIDDRGKYLPFAIDAKPVDERKTDRGTFEIYEPSAFHNCPAKKKPAPAAIQERLL